MANQDTRKTKEMKSLFDDPKFARQAWKAVGNALLNKPASRPIPQYDKDGNTAYATEIENYTYKALADDVASLREDHREPTQLEMILGCQIIKARTDTGAAIFVRDTVGAKPVDESKVDQTNYNAYEDLTDEELELLRQHRATKLEEATEQSIVDGGDAIHSVDKFAKDIDEYVDDDNSD